MGLIFRWMLVVWVATAIVYWVVRFRIIKKTVRKPLATARPAAHTDRMTNLPEYIVVLKRYRLLIRLVIGLLSIGLLAAVLLSARPASILTVTPTDKNRDIMLCLDASGSVLREDTILIDRFSTLVNSFNGQRFSLSLFNSSAVTVIPLNSNYQLTSKQLVIAAQAFKAQKGQTFTRLTNSTLVGFKGGTSLVSDGLASCIQHMDNAASHRSQSIILATDNEVNGKPIVDMAKAVALANKYNIHIYALDPGVGDAKLAANHAQLKTITKQTGGNYYQLSDEGAVNNIIQAISTQQPTDFVGLNQHANNDNPTVFLYVAAIVTITALGLIWRLKL